MGISLENPETVVLHAGHRTDPATDAVAVPVYQTSSYQFTSADHAAALFARRVVGLTYSRTVNPTCTMLEQRLAILDGGQAGLVVASGAAARLVAILNLCRRGDNIIVSDDISPPACETLTYTLQRFGITSRFVDARIPNNFIRASDARTRCWFGESLSFPALNVFPITPVAAAAEQVGVPLIIDNSLLPVLTRPLADGAHITVYDAGSVLSGVARPAPRILLLSAGLEHPDDLRDDLARALDSI